MLGLIAVWMLASTAAHAAFKCTWNSESTFFGCDGMGVRNSAGRLVAGMGEIQRLNPAALPTMPTPLGVEFNAHSRGQGPQQSHTELTLIKGLPYVGMAAQTWNVGSLSGPDIAAALEGSPYASGLSTYQAMDAARTGNRLGLALQLPLSSQQMRVRGGVSIGQGKIDGENSTTFGLLMDSGGLNVGLSRMKHEPKPGLMPAVTQTSLSVGAELGPLYLGLVESWVSAGAPMPTPGTMLSLRWADNVWTAFGAVKFYTAYSGRRRTEGSFTLHHAVGNMLALGYLYGLYPGSHSLSAQMFF